MSSAVRTATEARPITTADAHTRAVRVRAPVATPRTPYTKGARAMRFVHQPRGETSAVAAKAAEVPVARAPRGAAQAAQLATPPSASVPTATVRRVPVRP